MFGLKRYTWDTLWRGGLLTKAPGLHSSSNRHAVSPFHMPAMSPTMTEGGISAWKKQEGQPFAAGDVLLEIVWIENRVALSERINCSHVVNILCRKPTRQPLRSRRRMMVYWAKFSYARVSAGTDSLDALFIGSRRDQERACWQTHCSTNRGG